MNEIKTMQCYVASKPTKFGLISDFSDVDEGMVRVRVQDLFSSEQIAKLITNKRWIEEARQVIGNEPIAVAVEAWWSKPCSADRLSDAAQMWHRDLDRLRDVKLFFYATDVMDDTGPFEYVVGSHLPALRAISRTDGRLTQRWVQKRYPDRAISMTGPAGTTFIVDTHGIHRGRPVENGLRCVLQLYFASSLFGAEPYCQPRIALDPSWPSYSVWNQALSKHPDVWRPLFSSH